MSRYFKWLPNVFTLINLLLGCFAIQFASSGNLVDATYFVFTAMLFDFMDGWVARLFSITSGLGKELDSLADVVSFGVAPSFFIYGMASHADYGKWIWGNPEWIGFFAFSITLASAYRLARFNTDTKPKKHFVGFPTPANAFLICGWVWVSANPNHVLYDFLLSPYIILLLILISVYLPVSSHYFMSFKVDKQNNNEFYLIIALLLLSVSIFVLMGLSAIPFVILFYMLISIIERKKFGKGNV